MLQKIKGPVLQKGVRLWRDPASALFWPRIASGITLRSLCAEAGRRLELILVANQADLVHALPVHGPDVALIDLSLLQPDPTVCLLLLHHANPRIPLILVADPADRDCAVACLSIGAKDFMLEGFIDERTMARVLTSALDEQIETTVGEGRSTRGTRECDEIRCAFTAQLDSFETLQLQAGDTAMERLLGEVSEVLRKTVRSSDVVIAAARGKFVLYVRHSGNSCCSSIVERAKKRLAEYRPSFSFGDMPLSATIETQKCLMASALSGSKGSDCRPPQS